MESARGREHGLLHRGLGDGNAGRGQITAAQMLEVAARVIARGELIYDAEALRRVMAQSGA
jgi:hypothetical protein